MRPIPYPQDPVAFGHPNLRLLERIHSRYARARSTCHERILDLSYTELVSNPIQNVGRVHDHIEIPFTDRHRKTIQRFLNTRPKNAHGKHEYSQGECRLTPDLVRT